MARLRSKLTKYTHDCPRCHEKNISAGEFEQDEEDITQIKQEFVCDACGLEWYLKYEVYEGEVTTDLDI